MMTITNCTMEDYNQIIKDNVDFWGSERLLPYHHPYLVYEFGNTSFVIKEEDLIVAYLFGFFAQTADYGYIHLIGVRESYQKKGYGQILYNRFIEICKANNIHKIKAITTIDNQKSVNFHTKKIGMSLKGSPNELV